MWRVSTRLTKRDLKPATSRQELGPINLSAARVTRAAALLRSEGFRAQALGWVRLDFLIAGIAKSRLK
jgi:hypothetical protein